LKKFFKFVGISIIALVAIGIIVGISSGGGSNETAPTETTEVTKPVPEKPAPKPADRMTKANYNKIVVGDSLTGKGGWTKEQVMSLLGKPENKTESKTGDYKMEVWTYSKLFTMTSVVVSFSNDHVSDKMWSE
jgi:hypothetical protein